MISFSIPLSKYLWSQLLILIPNTYSILGSPNGNSIIDINVATKETYSVACQNYLQYSSRIKDLWPGLVLLLLVLYPWGFSILCTSTYCIYTVHCLCVRYHSKFFDCLAHPNLGATLATDQKWPLSLLPKFSSAGKSNRLDFH